MPPSLRAFLDGLFDYAGLFPPAALDLPTAARAYARYRTGPDAWMLGRFIAPVGGLDALSAHADALGTRPPLSLSVVGRAAEPEAFEAALTADLDAVRAFEVRHPAARADRFEVRLPEAIARDGTRLADVLRLFEDGASRSAAEPARGFFEVPLDGRGWERGVEATLGALQAHNERAGRAAAGLKLRCGGTTPGAVPPIEALALALAAARDAGVPFKATAGLHHPVLHADPTTGEPQHGFVGVFGAGVLAHARRIGPAAVARILAEERLDRFVFDEDGFAWNGYGATPAEVAAARAAFATSFGTCSFTEPLDDLRAAGLL